MRTADSPSAPVDGHREADPAGPFRAQQATFKMKEAANWGRLTELLAGYIRHPFTSLRWRAPRPFAIPLGHDVFHTRDDFHALVQGHRIWFAPRIKIVPRNETAPPWWDFQRDAGKESLATPFGHVQENHRRPCPLPATSLLLGPVGFAGAQKVVVRLELLTDGIALALNVFAMLWIDTYQRRKPSFDRAHDVVLGIEIAGFAGPKIWVGIVCEQSRWLSRRIDQRDERIAFRRLKKVAQHEQIEMSDWRLHNVGRKR
jgi:hypothetical protein